MIDRIVAQTATYIVFPQPVRIVALEQQFVEMLQRWTPTQNGL